ncbi:Uncharacterized protein APZ42_016117 [Daphnia magna]|uniref:Uncharacterized protein n=2 Tax=Daphnia magna TaxID=35525 RepID=A0A162CG10_9CRUS|nr:hypothetical protein OUZ56_006744 [Daphnia magna]KZS18121.1 Uncharacterized protein APZ42_016117 [Daphnia magna]
MATKLKAIIPPVTISQRPPFTSRDDGQQLIRKSVRTTSSRPKFSIRSKKSACKNSKKVKKTDKTQRSTSTRQPPAWDAFEQSDPPSENAKKLKTKTKKRKISLKIVRKAGQRIEWLLKKGANYFGIAIIKIFNQPGLYTEESRTCVC